LISGLQENKFKHPYFPTLKTDNMKKYFLFKRYAALIAAAIIFSLSCNKSATIHEETPAPDEVDVPVTQRTCASYEVLQQQLKDDPSLAQRMNDIESFTRNFELNPQAYRLLANGNLEIPVVVNVLYRTTAQNISQSQIQSQIDVLNEDYAATNADYNLTSTYNSVKSGNTGITFVLDRIVRRSTTKNSWTTNDAMKKSAQGIAPTSPTTKLNLWVCNLSGGVLGYAQFPGGNSNTDGVVIDDNAMGRTGTAAAPFNKGRTATHEIGHWFNLRHIWGDTKCGNDFVNDTPLHPAANFGCPPANSRSTCSGTPIMMTMNYMDYTDDACMYMFSAGQKGRMQATFAVGGPRVSFR
jgi:hypothetical protein